MPRQGPKGNLGDQRVFTLLLGLRYTGMPWQGLPGPTAPQGKPAIHDTTVSKVCAKWADDGSLWQAFGARVRHLAAEKPLALRILQGEGPGYSGHTPPKGETVIALPAPHGSVCAPVPVAPGTGTDMGLFPEGVQAVKQVAQEGGVDLRGAYLTLDGGLDSAHKRTCIFNAGLLPTLQDNPRHRQATKRGRPRLCNAAIHA